ncbi:hypothetical protein [Psychrobacillus sp. OK032]|uniref:hypothetical protein n=1 Tax=Psychrobacillus sp. OK032 TaxID=1884358 RepID=UPI0008D7E6F0|nr:hypothetical protein [Psychrobacillus sp. OK032]SER79815.1 hypothetical protein SAMN05518872_10286 [Psychrobacillus sp. OK032]
MKRKMIALPFALSTALLLGACGDNEDELDDVEVNDPLLEDDGQNDIGVPEDENEEEVEEGTDSTENSTP